MHLGSGIVQFVLSWSPPQWRQHSFFDACAFAKMVTSGTVLRFFYIRQHFRCDISKSDMLRRCFGVKDNFDYFRSAKASCVWDVHTTVNRLLELQIGDLRGHYSNDPNEFVGCVGFIRMHKNVTKKFEGQKCFD